LIYVGSLQYSPVYKSLCCAFGKACEEAGYSVKYLFSYEYEWLLDNNIREKTVFVGHSRSMSTMLQDALSLKNKAKLREIFLKDKPSHFYMHNYHMLNHYIAKLSTRNNCRFIFHSHEPFVKNKKAHGGFHRYWLYISEYMEERLHRDTSVIIVSSAEASKLFDERFPKFTGQKIIIPLLFEDLGNDNLTAERRYISFIGPPVPAKGPEIFLKILDYAEANNLPWKFFLISRTKIDDPKFNNRRNLEIFYNSGLDKEFASLLRNSFAVLAPYTRETQSAGILMSYMNGTPVISSNVGGMPEFVLSGETGCLVDVCAPVEKWVEGISFVMVNFQRMSIASRKYFTDSFSGNNWKIYLEAVLE
jgi:glycosyltransferase involved in cell wall biosynthesis